MKKTIAIALCLILMLSLVACGGDNLILDNVEEYALDYDLTKE